MKSMNGMNRMNRPENGGGISLLQVRRGWPLLLLLPLFLFWQIGCEDSKKDEVDLEKQQWQFLLLTAPPSPRESCLGAVGAALTCADTAGGGGVPGQVVQEQYVSALEYIYQISVASPRGASEVCDVLIDAPLFPAMDTEHTYTVGAKICFLDCERGFWERSLNGGLCTASTIAALNPALDNEYQGCLNICLGQGTLLPP